MTDAAPLSELAAAATPILFFTGKGGVGKTTLAAATAVALADQGRRVLLVSTDPASNLDDVLGTAIGHEPTPVAGCPTLAAVNIAPEAAAADYRERVVAPYRGVLPEAAVRSIEEQLSGACTMEIAAFDEFVRLLAESGIRKEYDHLVFDTAPTGHTLRLLQLPGAWADFLADNTTGVTCIGPVSGLKSQEALYKRTRVLLADASLTTMYLVARPDGMSLTEAGRAGAELAELGITNQRLLVNGLYQGSAADPLAQDLRRGQRAALASLAGWAAGLPRLEFPLLGGAPLGIDGLRRFARGESTTAAAPATAGDSLPPGLDDLLADLAKYDRSLVMTMGKGGVGKTTIATRLAVGLARRGREVHLATTDPAAHLDLGLGVAIDGLTVSHIDPVAVTQAYRDQVLATAGKDLDEEGRRVLEEDLRSPCTEEIAVFQAFALLVDEHAGRFLVLDTAPTGHTLLLLDAAQSYHREVSRNLGAAPAAIQRLLPRLRDPGATRIYLLTLAETTPVHEAAALQEDLRRAGIGVAGWIVNQSLAPLATTDPVLEARRRQELAHLAAIR
ncbi:MAG TPA: arsenical pump-driving ATPase, partial [Desulfobacterales bacterium]|nr:arsenical pump-driving ATPase [Desulfobacterales bacterium]